MRDGQRSKPTSTTLRPLPHNPEVHIFMKSKKKYGLMNFVFDVLLVCVTGGLWLIWVFCREMRNR